MASAALSLVIAAAVFHLAVPQGPLLTAPQRDTNLDALAPRSVDVSAGGRYVAFESLAALVPADTNERRDIYVLDLVSRSVTLESDPRGDWLDTASPRLSSDGRRLVFEASADVPGGIGFQSEIVLCDRPAAVSRVISRRPDGGLADGPSRSPDISDDGEVIVFGSSATNLIAGADANSRNSDIYAYQVSTAALRRVSVDAAGDQPADGYSITPGISGDGRWVAFASTAALDGLPVRATVRDRRELRQVFVRDLAGAAVARVSIGSRAEPADGDSWGPAINRDGRYVAFVSEATNFGGGARNRAADIFMRDVTAGTTALVSRAFDGEDASGAGGSPAISADGRYVAFQSDASNLVCGKRCRPETEDINLLWDVFVFDRHDATISRLSGDTTGEWMEASRGPALDDSAQVLAFSSRHRAGDADRKDDYDLFVSVAPATVRTDTATLAAPAAAIRRY